MVAVLKVIPKQKKCSSCMETMPAEAFALDKTTSTGLNSRCRPCHSAYYKNYYGKTKEKHRNKARANHLKRVYKIDATTFEAILQVQGGGCAICGETKCSTNKRHLCVDHNHKTGAIRGILCDTCNVGIGNLKDDVKLLRNAIAYLQRSGGR